MKANINNNNRNDDTKKVSEHGNNKISKILAPIDGSELSREEQITQYFYHLN